MYILINENDVIVGTSLQPVANSYLTENNLKIFQINSKDFKLEMLGSKLTDYEEDK